RVTSEWTRSAALRFCTLHPTLYTSHATQGATFRQRYARTHSASDFTLHTLHTTRDERRSLSSALRDRNDRQLHPSIRRTALLRVVRCNRIRLARAYRDQAL